VNYELDALIDDAALGGEARDRFLSDLDDSHEITMRSRIVGH
jgi:hypothetical protein